MAYLIQNKFPIDTEKRKAVGFSFPLSGPAVFNPTYNTKDQIKSNLINYMLTNRGERYLNSDFGFNLREFIFEAIEEGNINILKKRIQKGISTFFSNVLIQELDILKNEEYNRIKINITYNVVNFGIEDNIQLTVQ